MKQRRKVAVALALIVLVAACGDSDSTGGVDPILLGPVTDLDGRRTIEELAPAEQAELCSDGWDYLLTSLGPAKWKEVACGGEAVLHALVSGLLGADRTAACEQAYVECLEQPDEEPEGGEDTPPQCSFGGCGEVTVDEWSDCLRESASQLGEYRFSCDDVRWDGEVSQDELDRGPACAKISDRCRTF